MGKVKQFSAPSLYACKRRLHGTARCGAPAPRLVPVHLVSPPASAPLELLLPSGLVLRPPPDTDLGWVRQLLGLLSVITTN
jgi:hypothetical protein